MSQAFDDIAAKTGISDHHPDAREGVTAFREKREPHFNRWLEQDPPPDRRPLEQEAAERD
jgi:hypothetical protein